MEIVINGEPREVQDGTRLGELLRSLGTSPGPVAIELNGAVLPRSIHEETELQANDQLEVVTFVGGG